MAQLILTAVGADRPGLVGELTGVLAAGGGNIVESRMVNLRGEFAVMILVEGRAEDVAKLQAEWPRVGEQLALQTMVAEEPAGRTGVKGVPYKVKTYSMDQPGLVHQITAVLRRHGVNIEELTARQESAPFAGGTLFTMELRVTVPGEVAIRKLRSELETACEHMNCDLDLEPA